MSWTGRNMAEWCEEHGCDQSECEYWHRRIDTEYYAPPIPIRQFDWCATRDGYEPGDPIGYGSTREAAIQDLKAMEGER